MSDLLYFFGYLYKAIGWRLFIWFFLIVGAAILEGLSVSLFLPILSNEDQDSAFSRQITGVFENLNLEYSLSLVLVLMVVFFVARSGFLIAQQMYASRIVVSLLVNLKRGLIDKIFNVDYQYFLRNEIGYYNNATTVEYNRVAFAFETCLKLVVSVGFALMYFSLPLMVQPILQISIKT